MPDLPWLHPTIVALAEALGVTDRSLQLWRKQGAPIPETGPFDELAVRLWHCLQGPGAGGTRSATLSAPADPVLAGYWEHLTRREVGVDYEHEYDKERVAGIRLDNATKRKAYIDHARTHFNGLLTRLRGKLAPLTAPAGLAALWRLAHDRPQDQAQPDLAKHLTTQIDTALAAALED